MVRYEYEPAGLEVVGRKVVLNGRRVAKWSRIIIPIKNSFHGQSSDPPVHLFPNPDEDFDFFSMDSGFFHAVV
jgi:hypothetical protein